MILKNKTLKFKRQKAKELPKHKENFYIKKYFQ